MAQSGFDKDFEKQIIERLRSNLALLHRYARFAPFKVCWRVFYS